MEFPDEIEDVISELSQAVSQPRAFVCAVDGRYGVGKSTTSRYLAHSLGFSCVHTDDYLLGNGKFEYRDCLIDYLRHRLEDNKPVIVDAVYVARLLAGLNFQCDFLLRVHSVGGFSMHRGRQEFEKYELEYPANKLIIFPDFSKRVDQ